MQSPLLGLSDVEIRAAAAAVREFADAVDDEVEQAKLRFNAISLHEPSKQDVIKFYSSNYSTSTKIKNGTCTNGTNGTSNYGKNGSCTNGSNGTITANSTDLIGRKAEVVTMNPRTGLGSEYIVALHYNAEDGVVTASVESSKDLPAGVQPMISPDDCLLAEKICISCEEVVTALKERYGITDLRSVCCDPWAIHLACEDDIALTRWNPEGKPGRLVQVLLYYRPYGDNAFLECNQQAHPIDIVPMIDVNERKLIEIFGLDRNPPPPIPMESVNFHRNLVKTNSYLENKWRDDTLKALHVVQPEGPSFTVHADNVVKWQNWSIEIGFNYREGLVIRNVHFKDRSVLHRASLVEMAVPYGDVHPPYTRKCAFDVGDYGLGYCADSLELGCDCLGHIHYFSFTLSNSKGEPEEKKNVVCMHEQDAGLLWKHVEYRTGHNESRRSRILVISFIATVVNYEYLFYWIFKQDGTIEYEIKLSGELSTNTLSKGEYENVVTNKQQPEQGLLVAPAVNAQYHQHLFCARLDMAVDGHLNTVSEVDVVPLEYDPVTNPYGNGFAVKETVLQTEKTAVRVADPSKARCWKISNASGILNKINHKPTAYKLVPYTIGAAQPLMLAHPKSTLAKKGAFATANLWVTKHSDTERYPAGEYTVQQVVQTDGLPNYIEADRNIVASDIVLWHCFGTTHIPRIEDFPVSIWLCVSVDLRLI